jgi:hypothetical protein
MDPLPVTFCTLMSQPNCRMSPACRPAEAAPAPALLPSMVRPLIPLPRLVRER